MSNLGKLGDRDFILDLAPELHPPRSACGLRFKIRYLKKGIQVARGIQSTFTMIEISLESVTEICGLVILMVSSESLC